jgi:DNA polymerase III alpha subunit
MLFVKIEDAIASTELLIFPSLYEATMDLWQDGRVVLVQGKLSDKDNEVKLLVDKAAVLNLDKLAESIDAFKKIEVKQRRQFFGNKDEGNGNYRPLPKNSEPAPAPVRAEFPPLKLIFKRDLNPAESIKLKEILAQTGGQSKVYFKIMRNGAPVIVEGGFRVRNDSNLTGFIKKEFFDAIEVVDAK